VNLIQSEVFGTMLEAASTTDREVAKVQIPMGRALFVCSILVVLLAVGLRLHRIEQRSIWFDEAVAANISRGTIAQTLTLARAEHSAPIIHPLILYVIEKVSVRPFAVRGPSLVASVLAVFGMLCFVRIPSFRPRTAVLAGLMLSVSSLQIRYAQEVREYSLSVLYSTLLIYLFLSYASSGNRRGPRILLYCVLFGAPLVQYGLLLFGFGILAAIAVLGLIERKAWAGIWEAMKASAFLGTGSLVSFALTLRYQWGGGGPSYLQEYYLGPGRRLTSFLLTNTHHLLTSFLPGRAAALVSGVAILFYFAMCLRARVFPPVLVLAMTSIGVVVCGGLLHVYPYGGVRQCLFLSPILCLLASESLVQLTARFKGVSGSLAFAAISCVVIVSGILQIRLMQPYEEIEDIQTVLHQLEQRIAPGDAVYVYSGAVPAVDFYLRERDPRFSFGNFHREAPEQLAPEMLAGIGPGTDRVWIVFSHIHDSEDSKLLDALLNNWQVDRVASSTRSALYQAVRRSEETRGPTLGGSPAYSGTLAPQPVRDSFWDWNIRNSQRPDR
jgi:hypothetical protein